MQMLQKWTLAVFMLLCLTGRALTQTPPNFSGNFRFVPANSREAAVVATLEIKQTATTVQITRTVGGKPNVENYTLDGSPIEWKTSTGIPIKASANWHGSELWLDSIATLLVNGHTVPLHSTEQWQLSKDSDTITIRTKSDAPNMPSQVYVHDYKRIK